MKCNDCGQKLSKYFTFSEKNEVYYCMNCCYKHVDDDLVYLKIKNNEIKRLNVGVSGAGIGKQFQKLFTNEDWLLRHERCIHLENINNLNQPIFYCDDGKLRCSECLYDENIEIADPLMKTNYINEEGDDVLWQLPFTYEPHNLKFSFECDSTGFKGEEITGKIIIKNFKKYPIKDILLKIESYSTPPWDGNKPYGIYCDNSYSKMVIFKELKIDLIDSQDILEISTKLKIPNDFEIYENQFSDCNLGDSLKIPNELMIFARFNYKTCTGYEYKSTIETHLVNIK